MAVVGGDSSAGVGCSGATVAGAAGAVVGGDAVEPGTVDVEVGDEAVVVVTFAVVFVVAVVAVVVAVASVDDDEAAVPAETSVVVASAELSFELDEQPASAATATPISVNVIQVGRACMNRMSDHGRRERLDRAFRLRRAAGRGRIGCARSWRRPAG
jgi:hypothetical protein